MLYKPAAGVSIRGYGRTDEWKVFSWAPAIDRSLDALRESHLLILLVRRSVLVFWRPSPRLLLLVGCAQEDVRNAILYTTVREHQERGKAASIHMEVGG